MKCSLRSLGKNLFLRVCWTNIINVSVVKISPQLTLLEVPGFQDPYNLCQYVMFNLILSFMHSFSSQATFLNESSSSKANFCFMPFTPLLCLNCPYALTFCHFYAFQTMYFRSCILHKPSPTQPAYSNLSLTDLAQHHMLMILAHHPPWHKKRFSTQ